MNLDIRFILSASLLIAFIIPLYIYRKKIFHFMYKTGDIDLFLKDIKLHMSTIHPKIKYDYSIITKLKQEKDIRIKQTLIIENILEQYFNFAYTKKTQKTVSSDKLWQGYEEKSKSSPKLPSDWNMRKKLAFLRDEKKCNRCARTLKLDDAYTSFAKDIENKGGYNFENIIILCSDCNKIINSTNPSKTIQNLTLTEELMLFVTA